MKLREYMALLEEGTELTCWDSVIDSEFYFYKDVPEPDSEFADYDSCMERLVDLLDVVQVHEHGVEVNLYDLLNNPTVIQYAKEHFYKPYQYDDDEELVELLFDDNVINISQGYLTFSKMMVECLDQAYGNSQNKTVDAVLEDATARTTADVPAQNSGKDDVNLDME